MTETKSFQQGRTYIVKWNNSLSQKELKIKVLAITDTTILIDWGYTTATHDLQKFKYEYSIVEEVD